MEEKRLLEEIENVAGLLYQNREKEGIEGVAKLIGMCQSMLQNMTQTQLVNGGDFALIMMRELIESYQNQDILGMADCLMEKCTLFVQFISETKER